MVHTTDIAHVQGLEGKRVLVTGGSAGIGRATVLAFAASGAIVTAAARGLERLDALVAAAPKGSTIHRVVLDLTSEESCRAAIKEAVALMGGLDVIVNNGGPIAAGMSEFDHWSQMTSLHVTSAWVLVQEALPELKKSGKGSVVNVSSALGMISAGSPTITSYHAAKAAQDMVTRSLAFQLAKEGVRVNSVAPGVIATEALDNLGARRGESVEQATVSYGAKHPVGRIGQPAEVAHAIAFLASDLASFITGAIVPVDGGAELASPFNVDPM